MPALLLIEDSADIHALLRAAFASEGIVHSAFSAAHGIEFFKMKKPDVVVLDVGLPDDSGLNVFRQIHEIDARVPVIFLTGVVGAFSGGTQLWAAPLKIAGGALLTTAICLPSLNVLACLGGAHDQLRLSALAGLLLAALALNATLLLSFAPIAWIFSQSTDSIAFISCLHLALWSVSFYFGLRLVLLGARFLGVADRGYLVLWMVLVTLVSLQMMTTRGEVRRS